ncbi:MAG: hypothetical protein H6825_07170 [Planctomycetes bacterium]|nr:hypothetical protein [Planctomycetota bacterium]
MNKTLIRIACLVFIVLPLAAACSSVDPYRRPFEQLEVGAAQLDTDDFPGSVATLEELLAETEARAPEFALQRFYAEYLLTRAHVRASLVQPFLTEVVPNPSISSSASGGKVRPSRNAHLMAALMHRSFALEQREGAEASPTDSIGGPMLPPALEGFAIQNVSNYLFIAALAAYGNLGFEDDVRRVVKDEPNLSSVAQTRSFLATAQVGEEWYDDVFVFLFRALRPVDRIEAFRFAIAALAQSTRGDGTFSLDPLVLDEIGEYMTSGFTCTVCGKPVVKDEWICPWDNSDYMESVVEADKNGG